MSPRTAATETRTDLSDLLDFCRERHHVVLTTHRKDGSLQSSPVSCGVDDQGRFVVSTYPQRAKVANARRDERVSLVVLSDDWDGPWVQVDGTCEVIDMPDALEPLVDYFRSFGREHPDWGEYRAAMAEQGKSLLRVTPTRWGPVATGGFPPHLADDGS